MIRFWKEKFLSLPCLICSSKDYILKHDRLRIFKSRPFKKFADKEGIDNRRLCKIATKVNQGEIDVNYGRGVIKQRIARKNEGKSGGYRAIIYYRKNDKIFFIYGFAKKDLENIDEEQKNTFKKQGKLMLALNDTQLMKLRLNGTFEEIKYHAQEAIV